MREYLYYTSSEEEVGDGDGSQDACQVGHQSARHGMACVLDAHRTEVDGEDIERRVGRALEDARQSTHERVGSVLRHRVDHHAACTAAREGLHQGGRQSSHEVAVAATGPDAPCDAVDEHVHGTRGPEHPDGHEDGHQIGDDAHRRLESFLGSLDKGVVDVHPFAHAGNDEADNDRHQQDVGNERRDGVHLLLRHLREAPDDGGHYGAHPSQGEQDGAVEQIDALVERGDDDTRQGGEEGG